MHILRILFFVVALATNNTSFAQGKTMLAKYGTILDAPREFTIQGEVIVMVEDDSGKKVLVSYTRCPNSDRMEVTWWHLGAPRVWRVDCSGILHEEDVRGRVKVIVPAPRRWM